MKPSHDSKSFPVSTRPLVYVLILNWKSAQETIACCEALQRTGYPNYKILLIENGSPDDSERVLRTRFPDLELIQTGKNLGYGGGNNAGIRYAYRKGAQYVWILNPDTYVHEETLTHLVEVMENHPDVGVCGPKQSVGEEGCQKSYGVTKIVEEKGFQIEFPSTDPDKKIGPTDYVHGNSMLIRCSMIEKVGLLREDFFLYWEEIEYCFRANRAGWKTVICLDVEDRHVMSLKRKNRDRYYYFMARNAIYVARLQRKHVLRTVLRVSRFNDIGDHMRHGRIRDACYVLKRKIKPVFRGLVHRLTPPPVLAVHHEC